MIKNLFDIITNFTNIKKEKTKNSEKVGNEAYLNYGRNNTYDKYKNSHNYNNQESSLRNTDSLYKNYFQNNFMNNIHRIKGNEPPFNNDNNYLKYNNNNDIYRNKRNSMDKILSNKTYENKLNNRSNISNQKINFIIFNLKIFYILKIYEKLILYIIKDYSANTLGGTDAFRHNKTNQDSYLIKKDQNNFIFGIFDGHGLEGHLISNSIKYYLNNNANTNSFSTNEKIFSLFKDLSLTINSSKSFNSM